MRCSNTLCTSTKDSSLPFTCSKCKEHHYCSNTCKIEAWREHSSACEINRLAKLKYTEATCPFIKMGMFMSKSEADELVVKEDYMKYTVIRDQGNIGKGSYGKVVLVNDEEHNQLAMKIIEKEGFTASMYQALVNEVEIQKRIIHSNIIRLISYSENSKRLYIIMEYGSEGNLFRLLRKKGNFTEHEAFFYFIQTCSAIHFLHRHKIMHRDIKPENLLITKEGALKLCDFGCCTRYSDKRKTDSFGTVEYMAPEVARHEEYDEKIDVWSLGVLLYEMLHGHTPYKERINTKHFPKPFFNQLSEDVKELIEALLNNDASKRPEVWEVFNYPWVRRMQREFQIKNKDNILPNDYRRSKHRRGPISRSLVYNQPINNIKEKPIVEFRDDLYSKNNHVISNITLDTICESKVTEIISDSKESSYRKDIRHISSLASPISTKVLELNAKRSVCELIGNTIKESNEPFSNCMCEEGIPFTVKASGFRVSIDRVIKNSCKKQVKVLKRER